jgi:hypothetical protein
MIPSKTKIRTITEEVLANATKSGSWHCQAEAALTKARVKQTKAYLI